MFTFWVVRYNVQAITIYIMEDGIDIHSVTASSLDIAWRLIDAFIDGRTE